VKAHVVLSVDSKERHTAEIELHAHGAMIHGKEQTEDLYSAVDLVIDKVERQVQKQKGKIKLNRRRAKA
jgi:putative sigma-54 modulation protein